MIIGVPQDVPLSIPPVGAGEYVVEVKEWKQVESAPDKAQTINVQFNYVIKSSRDGNQDIPDKGRLLNDTVWDVNNANSKTKLRQIFASAGLPSEGDLDLSTLIGKTLPLTVVQKGGKSKDGTQGIFANVGRYLIDQSILDADKAKHQKPPV